MAIDLKRAKELAHRLHEELKDHFSDKEIVVLAVSMAAIDDLKNKVRTLKMRVSDLEDDADVS